MAGMLKTGERRSRPRSRAVISSSFHCPPLIHSMSCLLFSVEPEKPERCVDEYTSIPPPTPGRVHGPENQPNPQPMRSPPSMMTGPMDYLLYGSQCAISDLESHRQVRTRKTPRRISANGAGHPRVHDQDKSPNEYRVAGYIGRFRVSRVNTSSPFVVDGARQTGSRFLRRLRGGSFFF